MDDMRNTSKRRQRNRVPLVEVTLVTGTAETKADERERKRARRWRAARRVLRRRARKYLSIWRDVRDARRMDRFGDIHYNRYRMREGLARLADFTCESIARKEKATRAVLEYRQRLMRRCFRAVARHRTLRIAYKRKAESAKIFWIACARRRALRRLQNHAKCRGSSRCAELVCAQILRRRLALQFFEAGILARMSREADEAHAAWRCRQVIWKLRSHAFDRRLLRIRRLWMQRRRRDWLRYWRRALRAKVFVRCIRTVLSRAIARRSIHIWRAYLEESKRCYFADRFRNTIGARRCFRRLAENVTRRMRGYGADLFYAETQMTRTFRTWRTHVDDLQRARLADAFWRKLAFRRYFAIRWRHIAVRARRRRNAGRVVAKCLTLSKTSKIFQLWRSSSRRRRTLRVSMRRWCHGYCGAVLLEAATLASERARQSERIERLDCLLLNHCRIVLAMTFARWSNFVAEDRAHCRHLLKKYFWSWDQWVIERRVGAQLADAASTHARRTMLRASMKTWKRLVRIRREVRSRREGFLGSSSPEHHHPHSRARRDEGPLLSPIPENEAYSGRVE